MSQHTERRRAERRQDEPGADDQLSPEYLALLEVCGGEIRASDRAELAECRRAAELDVAVSGEKKVETDSAPSERTGERRRPGPL